MKAKLFPHCRYRIASDRHGDVVKFDLVDGPAQHVGVAAVELADLELNARGNFLLDGAVGQHWRGQFCGSAQHHVVPESIREQRQVSNSVYNWDDSRVRCNGASEVVDRRCDHVGTNGKYNYVVGCPRSPEAATA